MRELVLARHAESEWNVLERLNGDPAVAVGLTEAGREQARELGRIAGPVDLVAHSEFLRTRETAELAWPGVPLLEVPELNEYGFGRFEGTRWAEASTSGFSPRPRWTTSREAGRAALVGVTRFIRGYRALLARPEERIAVVTHGALSATSCSLWKASRPLQCWRASSVRSPSPSTSSDLPRPSR